MRSSLPKRMILVLLGMFLVAVPGITGCGGQDTGLKVITYGFLWDLTGRAAQGTTDKYKGLIDYLRMVDETDPIPGVSIRVVSYDTKSDFGRVAPGYMWLKGQGAQAMSASPPDTIILRSRFEADKIPFIGGSSMFALLDSEWYCSVGGPMGSQIEVLMQWIIDTWDYDDGKPKIGAMGLSGVPYYTEQVDMVEAWVTDYPDKFEYLGAQMVPPGIMSFSAEVNRLRNCDFIVTITSGPPLAAFTNEARNRGYENQFIGANDSYKGFWGVVKASVSEEFLDGVIVGDFLPWWDDDVASINEMKEYATKYRPRDTDHLFSTTGYINGWYEGMVLVDAVRRAVQEVGVDNVDGTALRDALFATDMVVEGSGNRWALSEGVTCFAQTVRLFQYDAP